MAGDLPDWTSQHASGAVLLGTITSGASGGTGGTLLLDPVPAGVTGLSVLVLESAASTYTVTSVTAHGQTTQQQYIAGAGLLNLTLKSAAEYVGTIPAEAEPILATIGLLNSAPANTPLGLVVGWLGNTLVHPQNDPGQPLFIAGSTATKLTAGQTTDAIVTGPNAYDWESGVGGAPPAYIDQVVAGAMALVQNPAAGPSFDLVVGGNQGAGGKSVQTTGTPRQATQRVAYVATAGQIAEIVAGQAGKSLLIHGVHLSASPSAFAEADLQSPSGTDICAHALWAGNPWDMDDWNFLLPVAASLYLYTAIAGTVLGTITYDAI